jgi:protein disulfide-isomerase A6
VFGAGAKSDPEPYEGGRTSSDIVQFAQNKASESKPPPEVFEITAKDAFTKDCSEAQVRLYLTVKSLN